MPYPTLVVSEESSTRESDIRLSVEILEGVQKSSSENRRAVRATLGLLMEYYAVLGRGNPKRKS